jgi:squalene-hopene/tetraprenyl-beta-curcumene cyclase
MSKVSYWSRTVIVPLLVLMALRPRARNPRGSRPRAVPHAAGRSRTGYRGPYRSAWGAFFKGVDACCARREPLFPKATRGARSQGGRLRHRAAERRGRAGRDLPGDGQQRDDVRHAGLCARPSRRRHRLAAVRKLLVIEDDRAYCQPCLSPVWDTSLAGHALAPRPGVPTDPPRLRLAAPRQITDVVGDWAVRRPGLRPGGWAFQYENPHYPDVDDTAVVGMLLHRNGDPGARGDRARARMDHRHAEPTAAGARSSRRTRTTTSTTFRSPITARCSIRRPRMSARCVSFLAQIGMPRTIR